MALSFDKGRWSLHGDAAEFRLSTERMNILDVLQDHNQRCTRAISPNCSTSPRR